MYKPGEIPPGKSTPIPEPKAQAKPKAKAKKSAKPKKK